MIRLYCVGIHFNKQVGFVPDLDANGKKEGEAGVGELVFMSGEAIFKAAQDQYDLRYQLTAPGSRVPGHIAHVGYTPKKGDHPRITFNVSFPYYGVPLSLTEVIIPSDNCRMFFSTRSRLRTASGIRPLRPCIRLALKGCVET